ncbi:MAG TPA: hypothetical protein VND64_09685 [Pirellulales bacterium]|nr:hypothetical protein [Pirellulales bacterium]
MATRPQFSLRMMFAAMTMIAAALGALVPAPSWYSGLAMMLLGTAFPAIFWIGARQGGSYARSFCLGAFAPVATAAVFLAFSLITVNGPQTVTFDDCLAIVAKLAEFYRFLLAFYWGLMPIAGLLGVLTQWVLGGADEQK